jgi:hypothetical protein
VHAGKAYISVMHEDKHSSQHTLGNNFRNARNVGKLPTEKPSWFSRVPTGEHCQVCGCALAVSVRGGTVFSMDTGLSSIQHQKCTPGRRSLTENCPTCPSFLPTCVSTLVRMTSPCHLWDLASLLCPFHLRWPLGFTCPRVHLPLVSSPALKFLLLGLYRSKSWAVIVHGLNCCLIL